jgi:two-component system LytT family response regulator
MPDRPIRVVVVDDEPLARSVVKRLVADEVGLVVVGEAGSGTAAVELIEDEAPDLVLLDVQMPGMNGFEVIERVGVDRMPCVIFVTAFDEYALRAFEVHAVDYLLKPVSRLRLRSALGRAVEHLRAKDPTDSFRGGISALLQEIGLGNRPDRVAVSCGEGVSLVPAAEIEWIQADGKHARAHTKTKSHSIRESLKDLEKKLNPQRFLRVHRSTIVNLERVTEIHPWFKGAFLLVLSSGTKVTTGPSYRDKVDALYRNRPYGTRPNKN